MHLKIGIELKQTLDEVFEQAYGKFSAFRFVGVFSLTICGKVSYRACKEDRKSNSNRFICDIWPSRHGLRYCCGYA